VLGLFLILAAILWGVGFFGAAEGLWSRQALLVAATAGAQAAAGEETASWSATVWYHNRTCQTTTYTVTVRVNGKSERRVERKTACVDGPSQTAAVSAGSGSGLSPYAGAGCQYTWDATFLSGTARVCTGSSSAGGYAWSAPPGACQTAALYFEANATASLGPGTPVSVLSCSVAPGSGEVTLRVAALEPWNALSLLLGRPVRITATGTAWPSQR
jgi:hypothetical protein